MSTLRKLGMAMLIALAFAGCKSKKEVTPSFINNEATRVTVPCVDASYDDADYFRDLGIGTSLNKQSARDAALKGSKEMILNRLGGMIQGVATDYSRTVAGQARADKVQRIIEAEFTTVVEKALNNADKVCEDMFQLNSGEFEAYYVIEISKKEIVDKTANILSEDEELEIEFNHEQFRKFAEKRMAEMKGRRGSETGE